MTAAVVTFAFWGEWITWVGASDIYFSQGQKQLSIPSISRFVCFSLQNDLRYDFYMSLKFLTRGLEVPQKSLGF